MSLLVISFLAGLLTVLAPCVLPLIPVIIGGSLAKGGERKRTFIIIGSLAVSIFAFTLLLKASTFLIDIPEAFWRYFSGIIIVLLGFTFLFERSWAWFISKLGVATWANKKLGEGYQKHSVGGDILMGAALGPVFSTCSPTYFVIIATVLPASIGTGLTYIVAYIIGLSLALFAIIILGEKLLKRLNVLADPRGIFKKVVGILFIILGILIATGVEKKLEVAILDSGYFDITKVELSLLEKREEMEKTKENREQGVEIEGQGLLNSEQETGAEEQGSEGNKKQGPSLKNTRTVLSGFKIPPYNKYPAPELTGLEGYLNTNNNPVLFSDYRGKKIVLVDFWTYSCINCQRTLPYLTSWYDKYADHGLEIIGVHTPEFAFEKKYENVERAMEKFGIEYPVVMDNKYQTWRAFGNNFWPRKYIIDLDGNVVYDHIGEGAYEETEMVIQALLANAGMLEDEKDVSSNLGDTSRAATPEIYFGSLRNKSLGNGTPGASGVQSFTAPLITFRDMVYLDGTWNITNEYASPQTEVAVHLKYFAQKVFMVAGSATPATIEIYKDGTREGDVTIEAEELYTLIEDTLPGQHDLELRVPENTDLQLFTFTFG